MCNKQTTYRTNYSNPLQKLLPRAYALIVVFDGKKVNIFIRGASHHSTR